MFNVCFSYVQVLKRGTLLQLLDSMRDASSFPRHLVKQLEGRIKTWLVPIYGYDEDEELARVPADRLQGACMEAWPVHRVSEDPAITLSLFVGLQVLLPQPRRRAG